MKQNSDHMQTSGNGTHVTSVTPRQYQGVTDSVKPASAAPSGTTQSDSRGKQGRS